MNTRRREKQVGASVSGPAALRLGLFLMMAASPGIAAVDARIATRPLTPQNIVDAGLPSSLQGANGTPTVGVGQPLYLDLLLDDSLVATQVVWKIDRIRGISLVFGAPDPIITGSSSATLMPSPLGTNVLSYDGGDRDQYEIVDRRMLVPDIQGAWDLSATLGLASNGIPWPGAVVMQTVIGSSFVGMDELVCTLCHANKHDAPAPFKDTRHATAFKRQINGEGSDHFNPNCIRCHVTGFDTTPGADNFGFDDLMASTGWQFPASFSTNNWDAMPPTLRAKANVQCEACHGPANQHMRSLGKTERIGVTLTAGNCGQCHDRATHHVKNAEWATAAHSQGYVFRDSGICAQCHSAVGFIDEHDPDYAGTPKPRATGNEGLACATCHDPHEVNGLPHQLRNLPTATLINGTVVTAGGAGTLCMNCHHARQDAETYVLGTASSRFGPHYGPQGDMLAGDNAIEYGLHMPSSRHLHQVENSCVGCHMQDVTGTAFAAALHSVGGHTWKMVWDSGTPTIESDDVDVTAVCQDCHGEIASFDFGGEDYDRDGAVEGVQSEIKGLMEELGLLLPPIGSESVAVSSAYTLAQRKAAYNYLFVKEDKSYGIHNPKYATAILRASIEDLRGGIDIDCDALVDFWEMAQFGSLTTQTGDDDSDGDGLTNAQEQALGTDPNLKDSDGDGVFDLAEFEGFSNPSDSNSVPVLASMKVLPALELGYLPMTTGSVVHFEAINTLVAPGAWTNISSEQISNGNWIYQLQSIRPEEGRFYRAVEE